MLAKYNLQANYEDHSDRALLVMQVISLLIGSVAIASRSDTFLLMLIMGVIVFSMVLQSNGKRKIASGVYLATILFVGWMSVTQTSVPNPYFFVIPVVCSTLLFSEVGATRVTVISIIAMLAGVSTQMEFRAALDVCIFPALLCVLVAVANRFKVMSILEILEWVVDIQNKDTRRAEAFFEQKQQISDALLQVQHANAKLEIVNARLEEAEKKAHQASQAKSTFMSNMSHELRTPLNVIIGYSSSMLNMPQMFENVPVHNAHRGYLQLIEENGHYLLGLINDILDLSKIEAGKLELHCEPVRLPQVFRGIIATTIGLVKDKPVQVRPSFDENLPLVMADPIRVRQILLNLMSNAIKFTSSGSVTLAAEHDVASGMVKISVIDTGIGIPQSALATIFDRFQQAERDTDKRYGGTGLGLDISKQLSQMHGGDLTVESVVGKGSTFSITLPVAQVVKLDDTLSTRPATLESDIPAERVTIFAPSDDDSGEFEMPLPIMLVEDDASLRDLIHKTLETQGFHVIVTHDGDEAVMMADVVLPVAIILDIHLPGISGWEVLEQLKANPVTESIPVIICTVDEQVEERPGVAAFLRKPITPENIVNSVRQVIPSPVAELD